MLLLWRTAIVFMRAVTGCGWSKVLRPALYLPIHWLVVGFMCLGAYSAALYYATEVFEMLGIRL